MNSDTVAVPTFVGCNYFCESGNPTTTWVGSNLYGDDPGMQCETEGKCCCGTELKNPPPWFSVDLPSPTTDIEARLCYNSPGEGMILQRLEVYIQ